MRHCSLSARKDKSLVWKQDKSITIIINVANALMRQIHVSEFLLLQTTYIISLFMYLFETYVNTDIFYRFRLFG